MKFLAWEKDRWLSKNQRIPLTNIYMYDKLAHFIREFTLSFFPTYLIGFFWEWVVVVELFGIIYEVRDGLVPYNDKGNIEGFSWKDLIANNIGLLVGTFWGVFL